MCENCIFYKDANAQTSVAPNLGCNKRFDPVSPGSDLNQVVRTDCISL